MFKLILAIFISSPAFACDNFIAKSEIAGAIAMQPGAGAKKCGGADPCVCFDGVDWETAVYDGEKFSVSSAKVAQKAIDVATREAAAAQEKTDFAALKAKIDTETATAVEIRKAFKMLLKQLGK